MASSSFWRVCASPMRSVPKPSVTPARCVRLERLQPGVEHDGVLGEVGRWQAELAADVVHRLVRDESGHDDGACVGDQRRGLVVHEVAVFDAVHARIDGHGDRLGRVGVRGDVGVPVRVLR